MYKFPEAIYPSTISYHYARSVFNFFQTQEQTKEFFKYLYFRINENYKKRNKGANYSINILRNDNHNYPLIDLNYNFFVLALAEWIEHYCVEKEIVHQYSKHKKETDVKEENGEEVKTVYRKKRDLKIECSIKERVLFDYSFSGWLTASSLHKNFRFDLMQVLMNNILGKHTYVASYNYRSRAMVVKSTLVKDEQKDELIFFPATSFFRSTLTNYYTKKQMKSLIEMSEELKRTSSKTIERNEENEFIHEGKIVKIYDEFDIENIEKTRDLNDGKYHLFEEKKDEEKSEEKDDEA